LQVGLLPQDAHARATWETLEPRLDLDNLEEGSYGLLPLVYRRLQQLGISDSLLPRLNGVYRKTWVTNQVSLSVLTRALQTLRSTHFRTMIVNETSATLRLYPELGIRPLTDVEIVIPASDSGAAARTLEDAGWRARPTASPEIAVASSSGLRFETPDGSGAVTLRTHPVGGAAVAGFPEVDSPTAELWEYAVEVEVENIPTLAPAPADELLYTCVKGVRGNPWRTVQWVADATMIIRADEVDWTRLALAAREQLLGLPLGDALTYLARLIDPPIPVAVQHDLARCPVTRRESLAHSISRKGGPVLGTFPSLIGQYIRSTGTKDPLRTITGAPRFVKHAWGLASWSEAPAFVTRTLARQLGQPHARERRRAAARSRKP
jgi:hypothetical protein